MTGILLSAVRVTWHGRRARRQRPGRDGRRRGASWRNRVILIPGKHPAMTASRSLPLTATRGQCASATGPRRRAGPSVQSRVRTVGRVDLFLFMAGAAKKIVAASALFLSCAALLAFVFDEGNSNQSPRPDELLSPLEVGLYAVRAERQSADYDKKAERQIAFATGNDNSASAENTLAEKEEKRARQSAFLAADVKSRIDHVLEDGKDQVNADAVIVSASQYRFRAFYLSMLSSNKRC